MLTWYVMPTMKICEIESINESLSNFMFDFSDLHRSAVLCAMCWRVASKLKFQALLLRREAWLWRFSMTGTAIRSTKVRKMIPQNVPEPLYKICFKNVTHFSKIFPILFHVSKPTYFSTESCSVFHSSACSDPVTNDLHLSKPNCDSCA